MCVCRFVHTCTTRKSEESRVSVSLSYSFEAGSFSLNLGLVFSSLGWAGSQGPSHPLDSATRDYRDLRQAWLFRGWVQGRTLVSCTPGP